MSKIEEVAKLVEIGKAKLVGKAVQTLSLKNLKNNAKLVFPDAFAP